VLAAYTTVVLGDRQVVPSRLLGESMFRAVPIAGAALIGDRLGKRRLWIVAASSSRRRSSARGTRRIDAAGLPPAPSRSVIPSIGFGLLYLVFGLLPGIILHFAFDAFWFAMPRSSPRLPPGFACSRRWLSRRSSVPLWGLARRACRRAMDRSARIRIQRRLASRSCGRKGVTPHAAPAAASWRRQSLAVS